MSAQTVPNSVYSGVHAAQVNAAEHYDPMTLFVAYISGEDGSCGCPSFCGSCCVSTIYVENIAKTTGYVPAELTGLITESEFTNFIENCNTVLHDTHWPIMPCLCAHFCLPFSPICAKALCSSRRGKGLRELLADQNTILKERGLYWEMGDVMEAPSVAHHGNVTYVTTKLDKKVAILKIHAVARAVYEANHPNERQLMPVINQRSGQNWSSNVSVQVNNQIAVPSPTTSTYPSATTTPTMSPRSAGPPPPPSYGGYAQQQQSPPAYAQPKSTSNYCNHCSANVTAGSRFCNSCGATMPN